MNDRQDTEKLEKRLKTALSATFCGSVRIFQKLKGAKYKILQEVLDSAPPQVQEKANLTAQELQILASTLRSILSSNNVPREWRFSRPSPLVVWPLPDGPAHVRGEQLARHLGAALLKLVHRRELPSVTEVKARLRELLERNQMAEIDLLPVLCYLQGAFDGEHSFGFLKKAFGKYMSYEGRRETIKATRSLLRELTDSDGVTFRTTS